MKKLAIITTHPIQYNAPLFAMLQQRGNIVPKVFYTWGDSVLLSKYDPGFDKSIEWDIPLLEGYEYEFLENVAREKGSHHYRGIINPGIIKKITEWQADALLVYGWKFHSHLKVMRHFKNKIPVWFRGDSILLNEKKNLKSIFKNLLLKWVYKHIDIAFYTGTNNKNYFEVNGLKQDQLIKAFHAVDNERFQNTDEYSSLASQWRSELDIEPHDIVFLYAGKLVPTKNIDSLLKAFKSVTREHVHLIIVGNGPEEYELKNRYAYLQNLHFMNFQNQGAMPAIYQLCDIFVLPSIGETWGLSINEAMASGKGVLVSDRCGGAVDLVTDGENGYIFKAGNVDDLILKMKCLINTADKIKWMQENSLKKIQQFSFEGFVAAIESLQRNSE